MPTAAVSAQGTLFKVDISGTYTAIPEVRRGGFMGMRSERREVTNHDSTAGVREFLSTYREPTSVTLEGNYIPGNAVLEAIRAAQLSGATMSFKFTMTAGTNKVQTFSATIDSFEIPANTGEEYPYTITLGGTGAPTWGAT